MKKKKNLLITAIYVLLILVMAVSATVIITEIVSREQAKKDFSDLSQLIMLPVTDISGPSDSGISELPDDPETPNDPETPDDPENPDGSDAVPEQPTEPDNNTEPVIKRDIALLSSMNPDCIGWVQINGTSVDYPVMYTPGWNEKYLKKNFEKKRSSSGTPFMEERCELSSDNVIIYGHNMTNGTMFASLAKYYEDYEFFQNHPTFEFETEEGCRTFKVFAVAKVVSNEDWYYFVNAADSADFDKWISYIKSISKYYVDYDPKFGDSLVTLSTCYGSAKNGRLIIVGAEVA